MRHFESVVAKICFDLRLSMPLAQDLVYQNLPLLPHCRSVGLHQPFCRRQNPPILQTGHLHLFLSHLIFVLDQFRIPPYVLMIPRVLIFQNLTRLQLKFYELDRHQKRHSHHHHLLKSPYAL